MRKFSVISLSSVDNYFQRDDTDYRHVFCGFPCENLLVESLAMNVESPEAQERSNLQKTVLSV